MRTIYNIELDDLLPSYQINSNLDELKLRFLPMWLDAAIPGLLRRYHYHRETGAFFECRLNKDDECLICSDMNTGWDLFHKAQYIVLILNDPQVDPTQPQFFKSSSNFYFRLLEKSIFPEYNRMTDPYYGHDVFINTQTSQMTINSDTTPISRIPSTARDILEKVTMMPKLFKCYAQLHRHHISTLTKAAITH